MPAEEFPLLLFPRPTLADRNTLGGGGTRLHFPTAQRQIARIRPQLTVLQQAIEQRRLKIQGDAPLHTPELILVLEVAGTLDGFAKAVKKVPGLEWLFERVEEGVEPDEDFYHPTDAEKRLSGRLFLLGSNQQAIDQLLSLWTRYQNDPNIRFERGFAPFLHMFKQLRTIRQWDVNDRVNEDVRTYWQDCINDGLAAIRFEIEAWHFEAAQKNENSRVELDTLVRALGGRLVDRALIPDISYHGFLVELPATAIAAILAGEIPELLLSDRIMFFRPRAQSISGGAGNEPVVLQADSPGNAEEPPVIALLDGLPLQNHPLLENRLIVDDPDGWEEGYESKDRVHGTAMASLILHGELDNPTAPSVRRLYVRPIMRPDPLDTFHARRREHTPDTVLLIDLVHRAVRRICEGENGQHAFDTIRVINLSVGLARLFSLEISPWGRLLDWLSFKYSVLFIVSAGNNLETIRLNTPPNSLAAMTLNQRTALALTALIGNSGNLRLFSPAEAVNVLTVGAIHADSSQPQVVSGRYDLFTLDGISPISRMGLGFRRSVKPDILMPGGRVLYLERQMGGSTDTELDAVTQSAAPGHRVATPPMPNGALGATAYCRGTSNSAALASRAAERIFDVIESLRPSAEGMLTREYDAPLIKALLVHGARWGNLPDVLLPERLDLIAIENTQTRQLAQRDYLAQCLGYGVANVDHAIYCTAQRATLIGVGKLGPEQAFIFSAPLPPGLAGNVVVRRFTMTLAWMTPINSGHQAYRRAKLWATAPDSQLRVKRKNSVNDKTALRGTLQHEIFEGDDALAFVDGDHFKCKVNCKADAGDLDKEICFALCISIEVPISSGIAVYDEIRTRISPAVVIQPPA